MSCSKMRQSRPHIRQMECQRLRAATAKAIGSIDRADDKRGVEPCTKGQWLRLADLTNVRPELARTFRK